MRNFRIQESSSFLSASLSLTFGVMVSDTMRLQFEEMQAIDMFAVAVLLPV